MAYKDKEKQKRRQERLDFINSLPLPIDRQPLPEQPLEKSPYVYKPKCGYIYIIHCKGFPYYKIGHTVMPNGRISELQTGVPFELIMEYAFKVKDMFEAEHAIHKQYQDKCIRGEWFLLTDMELAGVKDKIVLLKDYTMGCSLPTKTAHVHAEGQTEINRLLLPGDSGNATSQPIAVIGGQV